MKTEVLIPETIQDNEEIQSGYKDIKNLFKKMDATSRAAYVSSVINNSDDILNEEEVENDYLRGVRRAINEEYMNLARNGLYV